MLKSPYLNDELKSCSTYKYSQSSKVSSLARTIVYAIIGLIWTFFYSPNDGFSIKSTYLFVVFCLALLYLVLDITHYFVDTIGYHKMAYELEQSGKDEEILQKYYAEQSKQIERNSLVLFIIKYCFALSLAIAFSIGILIEIL